ncbi:hypothetical protein INS49_005345 [Diaporthe citri]|uniref:uncharacterized protein n=1 Tax=Diaporthe citri TaxID=83186 RepID=UPI001C806EC9|nr:uncharacterized protein INS49_005345 [Diaporthe citri]KAG6353637.1 hypothetical protein INS49_005345 [Diaporthe citri]
MTQPATAMETGCLNNLCYFYNPTSTYFNGTCDTLKTSRHHHPDHQPDTRRHLHRNKTKMPFFYSKGFGGKHFGTNVTADRHGVRRGPWRFSLGRFNCFK